MKLLKGGPLKKTIKELLKHNIDAAIAAGSPMPHLAIVLVGENPRSKVYIEQKTKFAESIGVKVSLHQYDEKISSDELTDIVHGLGQDDAVHGILVQLPLPAHFDSADVDQIINTIPHYKDVDGLTSVNAGELMKESHYAIVPATTRGIVEMIKHYEIQTEGKHIAMIGRSNLVGKPTALKMLAMGATVTVCHKGTRDLATITKKADIIIVAAGAPGLITSDYIKSGQYIIDVGITVNGKGEVCGDVDPLLYEDVYGLAGISPVPGGVGPLTVSGLFLNLWDIYKNAIK